MALTEVLIAELDQRPIEQSRPHLNLDRVAHYEACIDECDAVTVFRVHGRLLLADGYHRVAAAQRLGRATIRADVRDGEERDALEFAIRHAREQRGMTEAEVRAAIARRARGAP